MPSAVFILEYECTIDLADDRREGPLLERQIALLGMRSVRREVASLEQLRTEGRVFSRGIRSGTPFDFLIISAHGNGSGLQLSDGTVLKWPALFEHFGSDLSSTTVILSACSTMSTGELRNYLDQCERAPKHLMGYRTEASWADAALATGLMLRMFAAEGEGETSFAKLWNTFVAISDLLELDVVAITGSPTAMTSGSQRTAELRGRNLRYFHPTPGGPRNEPQRFMDLAVTRRLEADARQLIESGLCGEALKQEMMSRIQPIVADLLESPPSRHSN